jgi:alanyl-tRNA synthetase
LFKIVSESSVAAGVRRIEALTGQAALIHVQQMIQTALQSGHLLRAKPEDISARIEQLLAAQKAAEKEIEKLKAALADAKAASSDDEVKTIGGVPVLVKKVGVDKPAALRELADRFKDRVKSGIVILGSVAGDKALLIVVVSKDLTKRFHAGNIVKELSAIVGGGGGGRPDMAQAGGTEPEKLDLALEKASQIIAAMGA